MQLAMSVLPDILPRSIIAKKGDILVFGFDLVHQSQPNQSHGYRPVFLFELKPLEGFPMDERGLPPVIINGTLSPVERLIYLFAGLPTRIGNALGRIRFRARLGPGAARPG